MLVLTFFVFVIGLNYGIYSWFDKHLNGEKNITHLIWCAIWLIRIFVTFISYILFFKLFGNPNPEFLQIAWRETVTLIVCWMAGNTIWQIFKNLKKAIQMPKERERAKDYLRSLQEE